MDKIEQQTQKLLNMYRGLHPCSYVDRLYIPRAQRGRGLLSVTDCVELQRSSLFDYAANDNERLLKTATERESIAWSIPERNRGDARSKEVAVAGIR